MLLFYLIFSLALASTPILNASASCPNSNDGTPFLSENVAKGRCVTYSNRLSDGSMGFCAGYVPYEYFLPQGKEQRDLEVAATALFRGSSGFLSTIALVLPSKCSTRIKATLCASYFPMCEHVDEYFLDVGCGGVGEECELLDPGNGDCKAAAGTPEERFQARPADGGYLARCKTDRRRSCVVAPGYVPGTDMTWAEYVFRNNDSKRMNQSQLAALVDDPNAHSVNMTEGCRAYGMTYDAARRSCLRAVATTPCKSLCNSVHSVSKRIVDGEIEAACPLVSGAFALFLQLFTTVPDTIGIVPESSLDPYVQETFKELAKSANCDSLLSCFNNKDPMTVNLGSMLGAFPFCSATSTLWGKTDSDAQIYMFAEMYSQEYGLPDYVSQNGKRPSPGSSLGALIEQRANALGVGCTCVKNIWSASAECIPNPADATCADVARVGLCFSPDLANVPPVEPLAYSSTLAQPEYPGDRATDICADSLEDTVNQPSAKDAATLSKIYDFDSRAVEGLYFLQAADNLPPLPAHVPPSDDAYDPEGLFLNQPSSYNDLDTTLCDYSEASQTPWAKSKNSVQCMDALVADSYKRIPSWALPRCKSAYRQWVCSRAKMKLEVKRLCLLFDDRDCADTPEAGAADDSVPFVFALPRFPSYDACMLLHSECDSLFSLVDFFLPSEIRSELNALLDCNQTFALPCSSSDEGKWKSGIWVGNSCEGGNVSDAGKSAEVSLSFDGLPAFPAKEQKLFDFNTIGFLSGDGGIIGQLASAILKDYIDTLNKAFTTTVSAAAGNETLLSDECQCPLPLLRKTEPDQLGLLQEYLNLSAPTTCCQLPCILPAYPRSRYESWWTQQLVLGILGTAMGLMLIITFGVFKEKRSQRLILYYSISSTAVSLTFVATNAYGPEKVLCKSETQPYDQNDYSMCFFQACLLLYFSMCACCWWFCQIIELFAKIHLQKKRFEWARKWMHLFSWGYPALITGTAIALGDVIYYRSPLTYCFIGSRRDTGTEFDIYAFFWPIGVMVIFGIFLMGFVLSTIYTTAMRVNAGGKKARSKLLAMYRTPVLFVSFFVFIWLFIFAYRFVQDAEFDDYVSAGIAWVQCLMMNDILGVANPSTNPDADISILVARGLRGASEAGCGELVPSAPSELLTDLMNICTFGQSIFLFLVFGLQASVLRLWKKKSQTLLSKMGVSTIGSSRGSARSRRKSASKSPSTGLMKTKKQLSRAKSSSSSYRRSHLDKKSLVQAKQKRLTSIQQTAVVENGRTSMGSQASVELSTLHARI